MARGASAADDLAALTSESIEAWAGSTTFGRGRSYQRGGRVQDLQRLPTGELIAWVQGTYRYATRVQIADGELASDCSCPVGWSCKHAVAVLLEAVARRDQGKPIPAAEADDLRLDVLDEGDEAADWHDEQSWDEDDELGATDRRSAGPADASLRAYLQQQTKEQLVALVEQLTTEFDGVRKLLRERRELATSSAADLVKSARRELIRASAEPGYSDGWRGGSSIPNYGPVRQRLEALLALGHADEVVALGKQIVERGIAQVEQSHDEGETAFEVQSCIEVVYRALPRSSLSPAEQMLWAIDAELDDDYDVINGDAVTAFWELERSNADWSAVADALSGRLSSPDRAPSETTPYGSATSSRNYARDNLVNRLIEALEEADRADEIIPLCEREAPKTASYERLVQRLMAAERWEEAEEWARDGILATHTSLPGIASHLRAMLRQMRERHGDRLGVAALVADEFYGHPSAQTFMALKQASEQAGVWPAVRAAVLQYLETGHLPGAVRAPAADPKSVNPWRGRRSRATTLAAAKEPSSDWPLPASGLAGPTLPKQPDAFPMIDVLLQIAMAEKRPDDVLRWHERQKQRRDRFGYGWYDSTSDVQVAEAVAEAYPERSLEIWTRQVDALLQHADQGNYARAGEYLAKMRPTYQRLGREEEWRTYVTSLRETYRRRPRLVEILDRLLKA